ncbi:MAG: NUDIX hydrolase [Chloroflexota bacterium]|nr:NUDIX hydrolase [Chloroflexota bacterium]MDE2961706.1 NUDIX hydrolase [Chloroflexota bacterium]
MAHINRPQTAGAPDIPAAAETRWIYRGEFINLREDTVILEDGQRHTATVVEYPSSVCIVPVFPDRTVMLVRQFRKPAEEFLLEAPAGKMEPGEIPEAAALRELQEEIGHTAGRLNPLATFYTEPALCTQRMHVFLARDLTPARLSADEDEFIDVRRIPIERAAGLIADGSIRDAKSISALLLAMRVMGDN